MTSIIQDLRLAIRRLRMSPGFAITIVATLALGIGANTAVFSVMHAVLLRMLPVHDPESALLPHALRHAVQRWQHRRLRKRIRH